MVDLYRQGLRLRSDMINSRTFYTLRCKQCGRSYPIIWRDYFPCPDATPSNITCFVNAFKELNDETNRLKKEKFREGELKRESLRKAAEERQRERLEKREHN